MPRLIMIASLLLAGGCLGTDDTEELSSESTIYTPFSGSSSSGSVSQYPWHGYKTTYPSGTEDMRAYGLPSTVECSDNKPQRSHLDVTEGCLSAINISGYSRGKIGTSNANAFRMVALPFTGSETSPLKWTDQSNSYRFYYTTSYSGTDPGFKSFIRYRSEDNLYVASWRFDGKVNIKRKYNGSYTTLVEKSHPKPSANTWHTLKFDAVGSRLYVFLDGTEVLSATDTTFSWGTSGIRTDGTNGAYIDDWRITEP